MGDEGVDDLGALTKLLAGMVTAKHRSPKSTKLRRKVPPLLLMLADLRPFFTVFGMAVSVLLIHGPVVGRPDYNGLRYLLAPWLCPAVIATYYYFKPYRPYRVGAARIADLTDYDAHDPDAQRLVEIFQSREARHFLLRAMLRLSGRLFGIMLLLAILHWQSLTWTLTSPWLGQGLMGGCLGSFVVLIVDLSDWGFTRWEAELSR